MSERSDVPVPARIVEPERKALLDFDLKKLAVHFGSQDLTALQRDQLEEIAHLHRTAIRSLKVQAEGGRQTTPARVRNALKKLETALNIAMDATRIDGETMSALEEPATALRVAIEDQLCRLRKRKRVRDTQHELLKMTMPLLKRVYSQSAEAPTEPGARAFLCDALEYFEIKPYPDPSKDRQTFDEYMNLEPQSTGRASIFST